MFSFETAIVASQLTRMRNPECEKFSEARRMEAHREARFAVLALISAFGAFSLFILLLDSSAGRWTPAADRLPSHVYGASQ